MAWQDSPEYCLHVPPLQMTQQFVFVEELQSIIDSLLPGRRIFQKTQQYVLLEQQSMLVELERHRGCQKEEEGPQAPSLCCLQWTLLSFLRLW